jgi:integrase
VRSDPFQASRIQRCRGGGIFSPRYDDGRLTRDVGHQRYRRGDSDDSRRDLRHRLDCKLAHFQRHVDSRVSATTQRGWIVPGRSVDFPLGTRWASANSRAPAPRRVESARLRVPYRNALGKRSTRARKLFLVLVFLVRRTSFVSVIESKAELRVVHQSPVPVRLFLELLRPCDLGQGLSLPSLQSGDASLTSFRDTAQLSDELFELAPALLKFPNFEPKANYSDGQTGDGNPQSDEGRESRQVDCHEPGVNRVEIDVISHPRPKVPSEATVPDRVRGWTERTGAYVEEREKNGEWSETTVVTYRGYLRGLQARLTLPGHIPPSWEEIGPANVRQLRESSLSPNTVGLNLVILRGFLRWLRNPLAEDPRLWRIERTDLGRRRWLTRAQAVALWNAATESERVPIGLMLFAGLRRIEVMRLRVRDCDFTLPSPTLRVCGKGKKWRTVPLNGVVWATLRERTHDLGPNDRVFPGTKNTVDRALYAAGRRAGCFGIRPNGTPNVSNHDLRRTYIRLTLETGKADLWDVAALVGHESVEMTALYAGLDRTKATEASKALEAELGIALPPTGV